MPVIMNSDNVKSIFNLRYLVYEESKLLNMTFRSNILSSDSSCSVGKGSSLEYGLNCLYNLITLKTVVENVKS